MFPDLTKLAERFWSFVAVVDGDGCWAWRGYRHCRTRYGMFSVGSRPRVVTRGAHRVAWLLARGPIPDRLCVLHRCDHPPCVRPDHLFLGTRQDNMDDMCRKGRSQGGERHWRAKLASEDVDAIRARYSSRNVTQDELGREYGVSQPHISEILHRKKWKEPHGDGHATFAG